MYGKNLCCGGNFHVLVVACAESLAEHIGEPVGFLQFLGVETVHRFVNVPFKVRLGNKVVCAEDNTFKVPPKAFNAVSRERTDSEFFLAVADEHVIVVCIQSIVNGGFVSNNRTAFRNKMGTIYMLTPKNS